MRQHGSKYIKNKLDDQSGWRQVLTAAIFQIPTAAWITQRPATSFLRYHCAKVSEHQGILVSKSVGNKCQGIEASRYSEIDVLPDCQVLPDSNCMNYSAPSIELPCSSHCYTAALKQQTESTCNPRKDKDKDIEPYSLCYTAALTQQTDIRFVTSERSS